jgi:hypothetical protein
MAPAASQSAEKRLTRHAMPPSGTNVVNLASSV